MRPAVLLLAAALGSGCATWAEIHGPTFGVALELDHDLNLSPRLQIAYEYERWTGLVAGYGGGAGLAVSLLDGRAELYAEARGQGLLLPTFAVGGAIAYDPPQGWSAGLRAGMSFWTGILFMPPEYCTMGWWEQTREDPCPPTEYTAEDTVYPLWLPRINYRATILWPLAGGDADFHHGLGFDATLAWFLLGGTAPGPVVQRPGTLAE